MLWQSDTGMGGRGMGLDETGRHQADMPAGAQEIEAITERSRSREGVTVRG